MWPRTTVGGGTLEDFYSAMIGGTGNVDHMTIMSKILPRIATIP